LAVCWWRSCPAKAGVFGAAALVNATLRTPEPNVIIERKLMSTRQAADETGAGTHLARPADPLLTVLLAVNLLLFAGGAVAHSGVPIPLGFDTWEEPLLVPAAIIEGVGAVGLLMTLAAMAGRANWAYRMCWWVLWYCFVGVLWGMARLAMGSIPEAHTMSNDFLHIGMTLLTTVSLVRLARLNPVHEHSFSNLDHQDHGRGS
jgi:hypothetical protein